MDKATLLFLFPCSFFFQKQKIKIKLERRKKTFDQCKDKAGVKEEAVGWCSCMQLGAVNLGSTKLAYKLFKLWLVKTKTFEHKNIFLTTNNTSTAFPFCWKKQVEHFRRSNYWHGLLPWISLFAPKKKKRLCFMRACSLASCIIWHRLLLSLFPPSDYRKRRELFPENKLHPFPRCTVMI